MTSLGSISKGWHRAWRPARHALRPKNAYNLLRLLITAEAWLRTGEPSFVVPDAARDRLLAIKKGEVALDLVLAEAEALAPALEAARDASPLPARPDVRRVDALSRRIGEELARRWIERAPGPFGADAPAPPEIEWQEDET